MKSKREKQNNNNQQTTKEMKKFYILAAGLLAAGSMMATPTVRPEVKAASNQPVQMTEEGLAMTRAEEAYAAYVNENNLDAPGMQKFTWTDPQGNVFKGAFMESGEWADNFTGWAAATHYSKVTASITTGKGNTLKTINHMLFYPRFVIFTNFTNLVPGTTEADSLKTIPLSVWGSGKPLSNFNFKVPALSENGANSFYIGMADNNNFVIVNTNTPNSSNQPYFTSGSMGYNIYNGTRCGSNTGATLKLSNFDNETSSIDMTFNGNANNAAGSMIWTYNYAFSGNAFMPGFTTAPQGFEAASIHVVNTGSVKGTDDAYYDIDDNNWGPFQRFYLLACGEGYSYDNVQLQGGGTLWTSTTIPTGPCDMGEGKDMTDLRGALFAANGADKPNGVYTLANIEVGFSGQFGTTTGKPAVNNFLYGGWNDDYWSWSATDGMKAISEGYYWWLPYEAAKVPTIKLLDGTNILNYYGKSNRNCDYTVNAKAGLKVIYHYDPTDYLKTTELTNGVNSIFNDGANNFNVEATNGMINVTVDNAAMVNIYTTNGMIVKSVKANAGQTVSLDAANGIYLVKVGEKTVKVAL